MFITWEQPLSYFGLFHIIGIFIALFFVFCGIYLGIRVKKRSGDVYKFLIIPTCIMWALEIFKQIILYKYNGGFCEEYLPDKLCSLGLYIYPLLILLKNCRFKAWAAAFSEIGLFSANLLYFVQPQAAVNTNLVLISLQSFIFHWIIIGSSAFLLAVSGFFAKEGYRRVLKAVAFLAGLTVLAGLSNELLYHYVPGMENIDIFHISGHLPVTYPILSSFFTAPEPYPLYLFAFILFTLFGATVMYIAIRGIHTLARLAFRQ